MKLCYDTRIASNNVHVHKEYEMNDNDQARRRNKTVTHRKGNSFRREDDRALRAARHQRQERLTEWRTRELAAMAS